MLGLVVAAGIVFGVQSLTGSLLKKIADTIVPDMMSETPAMTETEMSASKTANEVQDLTKTFQNFESEIAVIKTTKTAVVASTETATLQVPTFTAEPTKTKTSLPPMPSATVESTATLEIKSPMSGISIGDTILFGRYEPDNDLENGKEPIEWWVIDQIDGKALLFSKKYWILNSPISLEQILHENRVQFENG